jgi:hypothetical protein
MKRRTGVLIAIVLSGTILFGDGANVARPISAESLTGASQDCGTYTFHEDLTKGRVRAIVTHVHHTVGCFTYDYTNQAPAGAGEAQGNPWQMQECVQDGKAAAVGHFRWYRGIEINADDVKVSCTPYTGPD